MSQHIFYYFITIASKFTGRFVLLFILANAITLNEFGLFTYALTLSGIFLLFFDYGHNVQLLKDIPRNISNIPIMVGTSIIVKVRVIAIISFIFYAFDFFSLLNISHEEQTTVMLLLLATVGVAFINLFVAPFKAVGRFEVEALIAFIDNILTIIVVLAANTYYGFDAAILAYFLSKTFIFIMAFSIYKRNYKIIFFSTNDKTSSTPIFPLAIYEIIGGLYLMIDTVILKIYVPNEDIAIYQVGIRLLFGTQIILSIVNSVFLPRLSAIKGTPRFTLLFRKLNLLVAFTGLTLSAFLYVFGEGIVVFLFGDLFSQFSELLIYFCLIIFLRYLTAMYSAITLLDDKHVIRTFAILLTTILLIILDFIIIPLYGINGAAVVLLFAHILLLAIFMTLTYLKYKKLFIFL